MFKRVQSPPAEGVILDEHVGGNALLTHGFPQGVVCDQKKPPPKNLDGYYYNFSLGVLNISNIMGMMKV